MTENKTYKITTEFKTEIYVDEVYSVQVDNGFLLFKNECADVLYAIKLSAVRTYELTSIPEEAR